jgi:simple sugar transport system ATP-binding protein
VSAGEIVGIAGVEGNGQTTLADAISGMIPHHGTIALADAGMRMGIVPQDRHREALVLGWSIVDNAILGRQRLRETRRGALIDRQAARADAQSIVKSLDVRAASLDAPVKTLSGGNQQKIVVGRALLGNPQFVLAYQPTRGIDVGAAALVQSRLMQARNGGAAILLISFELDEILALADRVLVMYRGQIAGSFAGAEIDRARIGRLMAGSAA